MPDTSSETLSAQNHSLHPSDHPLPILSYPHILPTMPIPKPSINGTLIPSASPSSSTSADIRDTKPVSTVTLGVAVAGFIIVILLSIFTQILVIRIRRRRECGKIHWEYPTTKSNLSGVPPVSESGRSDLSASTTRLPLTETDSSQKTVSKTKLQGILRKISPLTVHGATRESIGLRPIEERHNPSTILRGT